MESLFVDKAFSKNIIFVYDFNDKDINIKINQELDAYDYCYLLNVL